MATRPRHDVALIVAVFGALVSVILLGWWSDLLGVQHEDLEVYRFGVEAWWAGQDIYGTLPPTSAGVHLPFLYPPFAVLILSPLAVLPWSAAVLTLFLLNLTCLVATLYVVLRAIAPQLSVPVALTIAGAASAPALLLEPLRQTFHFGQVNLLLMGLVAVDCLARRTPWPRGMAVGIAAAVKLTPVAFILFFLARRDYRSAAVAAATGLTASAVGFLIDWDASMTYWFNGFELMSWMSGTPYLTNQTLEASIARYDLGEPAQTVARVGLTLALLGTVWFVIRRSGAALGMLLIAAFALLASPTSWSHHWVWVAPAIVLMGGYAVERWERDRMSAMSWLCAATFTAALFYLAPFALVPGSADRELAWTVPQQFLGNSYTWFTILLITSYAAASAAHRDRSLADTTVRRDVELNQSSR
ncbi:glycosyltransferase 87 family protein [Nocardia sp. NPDC058633]|uniref:glycosyltransferase 87 family protein n=1 Tax=Nocardia sp. NPDC058633 TaxID=3346568 RepID=UPI003654020F